jgi:hypothetical protein
MPELLSPEQGSRSPRFGGKIAQRHEEKLPAG